MALKGTAKVVRPPRVVHLRFPCVRVQRLCLTIRVVCFLNGQPAPWQVTRMMSPGDAPLTISWSTLVYDDVKWKFHCMVSLRLPMIRARRTTTLTCAAGAPEPEKLASPLYRAVTVCAPARLYLTVQVAVPLTIG